MRRQRRAPRRGLEPALLSNPAADRFNAAALGQRNVDQKFGSVRIGVLTALAAVLAFIPLTFSAFWGSLAYTLIGGTAVGTLLTLIFLPALYSIWFHVKPTKGGQHIPEIHIA